MKLKNQKFFWLFIAMTLTPAGYAENNALYEIELIAFTHYNAAVESEQWPPHQRMERTADVTSLTADQKQQRNSTISTETLLVPAEFTRLSRGQLKLGGLVSELSRKHQTVRILLHTGWVQTIKPANSTVPVFLEGGKPLTPPTINQGRSYEQPRQVFATSTDQTTSPLPDHTTLPAWVDTTEIEPPELELEGTLAFYQTRYPRLETNLCLAIEQHQAPLPIMLSAADQSSAETRYADVCSREIRGLKYGELIYFDTPVLGLLAQVRRVKPASE